MDCCTAAVPADVNIPFDELRRRRAGRTMKKALSVAVSAIVPFLMSCWAFAATREMEGAAEAPAEMVDVVWVLVFGIGFVGMIVGFFVYMWWLEKKKKKHQ